MLVYAMVGHQHVCMNGTLGVRGILREPMVVSLVVLRTDKATLVVVASLNDVQRHFSSVMRGLRGIDLNLPQSSMNDCRLL